MGRVGGEGWEHLSHVKTKLPSRMTGASCKATYKGGQPSFNEPHHLPGAANTNGQWRPPEYVCTAAKVQVDCYLLKELRPTMTACLSVGANALECFRIQIKLFMFRFTSLPYSSTSISFYINLRLFWLSIVLFNILAVLTRHGFGDWFLFVPYFHFLQCWYFCSYSFAIVCLYFSPQFRSIWSIK